MDMFKSAVGTVAHWPKTKTDTHRLDHQDLIALRQRAVKVLDELITPEGIYASTAMDWSGPYHALFGRDSAVTASLVVAAEQPSGKYHFSTQAIAGLMQLAKYQGSRDNPITGEEFGKMPHEIRNNPDDIRHLQVRRKIKNRRVWHVNPLDFHLKNWDGVDSTTLWIITLSRWAQSHHQNLTRDQLKHMRLALDWCMHNIDKFGGLVGFVGADLAPGRKYGGLHNQTWKDSRHAYLNKNGHLPIHPIYDLSANAFTWSALLYGADIFDSLHPKYALKLKRYAKNLKRRINQSKSGFRMVDKSTGLHYYAEAPDGNRHKLPDVTSDIGLALWAYHGKSTIIAKPYLKETLKRLFKPDLFNPEAGLRTYSSHITNYNPQDIYHRGPDTYWPFTSALAIEGLNHLGYQNQTNQLAQAVLEGISRFDSCIELFLKYGSQYTMWRSPDSPQTSAVDQAWTAAAIYFSINFLLSR